jgi:microcystin-dependent protein
MEVRKSNFALPDIQGQAVMHPGQGPGLSLHDLGEAGGSETVTLLESEIPSHTHAVTASQADGGERMPAGQLLATGVSISQYQSSRAAHDAGAVCREPGGRRPPHNNMQPYLTFYFCIALQGVFPPRG